MLFSALAFVVFFAVLMGNFIRMAKSDSLDGVGLAVHVIGGLGQEELAMINRCKDAKERVTKKKAEVEKELGKNILDEQK